MSNYVLTSVLPPVTLTSLTGTPQTFNVNMTDMDTLTLDIDYTYVAGTALVITLKADKGLNDSNNRTYWITDYSAKTLTDATFTRTISAASQRGIATFSLNALGLTTNSKGDIEVNVSVTNGTTDSAIITPQVSRNG